jgi:signal transduction histidine kinase
MILISDSRLRVVRAVALVTGVIFAAIEWQLSPNADRVVLALDVAVGLTFFLSGSALLSVPTAQRIAALEFGAGTAWFAGGVTPLAEGLYLGFLVHLLSTYPIGRLDSPAQRIVVASGYVVAALFPQLAVGGVEAVLFATVALTAVVRASAAGGPLRRGRTSGAIVSASIAVTFALATAGLAGGSLHVEGARMVAASVLILGTSALVIDLRWGGWSRDVLTRLVIDLGGGRQPTTLRGRLAEALDDPTLVIGYRLDEEGTYVDDDGRLVDLPWPGSGRVAVPLTAAGTEVGILVRDERWPVDPVLADGVAAAAELALGNARLHAATRAQVADLEASRARLIAAAEAERDRIRQELDSGALRRLAGVRELLEETMPPGPDRVGLVEQAQSVMRQLEELSTGLGPTTALQQGLGPALRRLAAESPVPTNADIRIGRLPRLIESTAYFVCSEGLANVAKHAHASRVALAAVEERGWLRIEIVDDGVGGAIPSSSSGLEGLRQRVETTGGRLTIGDRRGGGTRLVAELPTARPAGRPVMA